MQIKTEDFAKEGMYLYLPDGDCLNLSVENIKKLSEEFWNDPCLLPPEMRNNLDFKTCSVCPFRGEDVLCSAMKPLLPFLQEVDKFLSCDRVNAVYVKKNAEILIVQTDLQKALQFITNMALFEYCENAKQFRIYFRGILPFMTLKEAIAHLIMNIHWLYHGDKAQIERAISELRQHVTTTSKSCIKRLAVMCKSDAFKNAYVKTQIFTEILAMAPDSLVKKYFDEEI